MSDVSREKYDEVVRVLDRVTRQRDDLRDEITTLNRKLERAEERMHELEPLEREKNAQYDRHIQDGGSDPCFRYGMSGRCGPECEAYGSKPECSITGDEQ